MTNNTIETRPFYIWEGIFNSFQSSAVEAIGAGFEVRFTLSDPWWQQMSALLSLMRAGQFHSP